MEQKAWQNLVNASLRFQSRAKCTLKENGQNFGSQWCPLLGGSTVQCIVILETY